MLPVTFLTLASTFLWSPPETVGLQYVLKNTRAETLAASRAATGAADLGGAWMAIGPFDNTNREGLKTPFPPETEVDFSKRYPGKGGKGIGWRAVDFPDGKIHNLAIFGEGENKDAIIYLARRIELPEAKEVPISLGSDDSIAVFLNGQQLLLADTVRACTPDQHRLVLPLQKGNNLLLLKIGQVDGRWEFYFAPTLPMALAVELNNRLIADFPPTEEGKCYRMIDFPIPEEVRLEVGGMGFLSDGSLLIGTREGRIWRIPKPLAETFADFVIEEWANGLHEITGMLVENDVVYVAHRPELTIVSDENGDGKADRYRTLCDSWGISGNYHEYVFGPVRGADGGLYLALNLGLGAKHPSPAPYRGWCVRVDATGHLTPVAAGLRSPNTIGVNPQGEVFYCDNQGEWIAACKLQHVQAGEFYGHPASLRWSKPNREQEPPEFVPPAVWFPYGAMSQSASEPIWDTTSGKFGPFAGQCFVGEQVKSLIMRVTLEKVQGRYQGACYHFRRGFESGVNRVIFAPDGSLFAGMTSRGWGAVGGKTYGLQRLVYTGKSPFEIQEVSLANSGFRLTFTEQIDPATIAETGAFSLQSYHYNYWSKYGSEEVDRRPVSIQQVRPSEDGRSVHLDIAGLRSGKVYEILAEGIRSKRGERLLHPEAYYTLNHLRAESDDSVEPKQPDSQK